MVVGILHIVAKVVIICVYSSLVRWDIVIGAAVHDIKKGSELIIQQFSRFVFFLFEFTIKISNFILKAFLRLDHF